MSARPKGTLRRLQEVAEQIDAGLRQFGGTPFGQRFTTLDDTELRESLVLHRATSKFEVPDPKGAGLRRVGTVMATLAHDAQGPTTFNYRSLRASSRKDFLLGMQWLSKTFKGFRPRYRFVPPTGESAVPGKGLVDVMAKLSDTSFWEVSRDALPYVTAIIYGNLHLKSIVRKHFDRECMDRTGMLPTAAKQAWTKQYYQAGPNKGSIGYYVFSRMVMCLMILSDVSRMDTVPKNNTTDRPIDMVPFWNMVAQLSLMTDIRDHIKVTRGIYIENLADLHQSLIRHEKYATIDLKNASNSVWLCVVKALWPKTILRHLLNLRTSHTSFDSKEGVIYHQYNMFGPMGCGLTFDVMTLTLWSVLGHSSFVSVFGDDIVLDVERSDDAYRILTDLGLSINFDKSFTTGPFRESCGGFQNVRNGERLLSYDLEYFLDLPSAFTYVNKVGVLSEYLGSTPLGLYFKEAYARLLDLIPMSFSVSSGTIDCGCVVRHTPEGKKHAVLSQMWQRPVYLRRCVTIALREVRKDFLAAESAHMFAGRWYQPVNRKASYERNETIDGTTGVRLDSVQLVTIL